MQTKEKLTCAFFFGEAESKEKAEQIAESYKNCPYVHIMTTKENQLSAVFALPERQKWWIEYIERKPRETFGVKKAKVTFAEKVLYPKRLKMRLPTNPREISPCGSNCRNCPSYKKCSGCPATTFYKHKPFKIKTIIE